MADDAISKLRRLEALVGPLPDKVEPALETVEVEECGSYRRHKIEYGVEKNERVRAYVLIPNGVTEPLPAVFCHHQHAANYSLGKSEVVGLAGDPNQAYAHELAERGYVTFAPDAIGFEERNRSESPGHVTYFELATRLVQGKTLLAKVLHDIMIGIDVLGSREEVDSDRIGFIGHSYGGRMALWAPVIDKRIRATVSNCGCARYADSLSLDAGIQMEICVPGILDWGDIEDVVKLAAPTPMMISAARDDKWSRGAQEIFDTAVGAFPNEALALKMYDGGHRFAPEMREAAYEFLDRHLKRGG